MSKQKLLSISADKTSNNLSQINNKTANQTSKASIERDIKFLNEDKKYKVSRKLHSQK